MKKSLFALFIIIALSSCHDVHKAPKPVQDAFDSMFPGATQVEWEKELSTYKAEFHHDGHEKDAWFSSDGKWSRTHTELLITEVPDVVLTAAREWSEWEIDDVAFCERADGVEDYYLLEFDKDYSEKEKILRILPNGTILNGF